MDKQTISNVLHLSALGDGWGYTTEFVRFRSIAPHVAIPNPVIVSDDTQMALAVIQGLSSNAPGSTNELLSIADVFLRWMDDPDNNRAPGNTCMSALQHLSATRDMENPFSGTVGHSKGCGANMRAGWLGLLNREIIDIEELAANQAKITHGHPVALESSALTARAVWAIARGDVVRGELVDYLLSSAQHPDVIEVLAKAQHVTAAEIIDENNDPCNYIGEAWVADEALAVSAKLFDVYDNPRDALHRAVRTTGDSDSIACITGSFVGAGISDEWKSYFPNDTIVFEKRYEQELVEAVEKIDRH